MTSLGAHFLKKKNTKLNPKAIMCVHFKTCCMDLAGTQINNLINNFCDIKGFRPSMLIGMAFWDPVGASLLLLSANTEILC